MHSDSTPVEEWRSVVSYEGLYEVSNLGHVRRATDSKHPTRPWPAARPLRASRRGGRNGSYLSVGLFRNGERKAHLVHRLVTRAFLGPLPHGMQVNHRDGDKAHNHALNLEYVTASDNTIHADKLGLIDRARGERVNLARLTAQEVSEIRSLYPSTEILQIARRYNVGWTTVKNVVTRKTWKHVE